jgi:hypothetical protein
LEGRQRRGALGCSREQVFTPALTEIRDNALPGVVEKRGEWNKLVVEELPKRTTVRVSDRSPVAEGQCIC